MTFATEHPIDCGGAEALMAARAAGSIASDSERALSRHLETCADCQQVARDLETSTVVDDFAHLATVDVDNYVRGAEIGRGGMGHVVFARDRRLGRAVAIKELIDERLRERFEQEARLTARLQHPAIVSVYEAGRWPSGEPFYAMKYVAGRPLDQVVAGLATLDERLGLLANLIIVVEAIAYAHSEGVIHRDLKPHNILIGAFGETVVIDWGLAKDVRAPSEPSMPFRDANAGLTRGGAGTPAYMSPEQARGDPPDERADVYALGATLHHLLAGDGPDRTPLPPGTPRDLRDIVTKATAADKDKRYRTAAELATELKRFENGQLVSAHRYTVREHVRRWLRRHRAVVLLAATFAVVLATVATVSVRRIVTERDRANRSKDAAESQRQRAEHLVDYMLGTLKDRLEPIGKVDILAGVGKEVEGYFASAPEASEVDIGVLSRRARALLTLMSADLAKGSFDDAQAEGKRAQKLGESWFALAPTPDAALTLTRVLVYRASAASSHGDGDAAVESLRQASDVLDRARALYPKDPVLRRRWGGVQDYLGREYGKRRDTARARDAYLAGIEVLRGVVVEQPGDGLAIESLATALVDIGDLEMADGHPDAAIERFDEAVRARPARGGHMDANLGVFWAYAQLRTGGALTLMGDFGRAHEQLESAREKLTPAVAQDPDNILWQMYLAAYFDFTCQNDRSAGDLRAATLACNDAASRLEKVLAKDPSRETAALELSSAETSLARIDLAQHDLAAAQMASTEAVKIAEDWSRRKPANAMWLEAVSEAEWGAASVARVGGRGPDAASAANVARAAIVGLGPNVGGVAATLDVARAELLIGDVSADAGDAKAAAAEVRQALATLEPAVARWPRMVELRARLAQALLLSADLQGNPDEAHALRRRADAVVEELASRGALAAEFHGLIERAHRR